MNVSFQSHEGHTTLTDLTDEQVEVKFKELTRQGYSAFASTSLDEPDGPLKTVEEARSLKAEEIFFIAPLQGG